MALFCCLSCAISELVSRSATTERAGCVGGEGTGFDNEGGLDGTGGASRGSGVRPGQARPCLSPPPAAAPEPVPWPRGCSNDSSISRASCDRSRRSPKTSTWGGGTALASRRAITSRAHAAALNRAITRPREVIWMASPAGSIRPGGSASREPIGGGGGCGRRRADSPR
jgi:hypothetical protein